MELNGSSAANLMMFANGLKKGVERVVPQTLKIATLQDSKVYFCRLTYWNQA